jgi:uncharacterized protein (TIGR03083 family)
MGRVYTFWLKWVGERPRGHSSEAWKELMADRDTRLPGFSAWDKADYPRESRPDGIVPFTRQTGDELHAMLVDLQPEDTVWTFDPLRQTGAFVFRRLAMETTIHLWDAQNAQGMERPFDQTLARDGIDEMLMMLGEDPAYEENNERRHGQTILLREDPSPSDPARAGLRWLVTFENTGITVSPEEGPANATVSGTASDLWLYIMGRRRIDEMTIEGDSDLAASWGDLAGRF